MNQRLERVRALSFRTALLCVGIAAAAFAVISLAVVLYVDDTLTDQVDHRLSAELQQIQRTPKLIEPIGDLSTDTASRFGPPLLVWVVHPNGRTSASDLSSPLPPASTSATPTTVEADGTQMRVVSGGVGANKVVVAQSMVAISSAHSTIILAELTVGSVLLVVTFLGALAVGTRVGAPIEIARQRQMDFTADASHELRTPLAVIEAQTSLALSHERDPDWYRQAFERVGSESRRIRRLVEDLLWLARVDASGRPPHPEPVDLGVLAAQAVDRFGGVAESRGLRVTLQRSEGSQVVSASSEWLDRLLGVLLDNACKYTPDGGAVRVSVEGDGHRVRLAVEDSGPGIPEDERPRVFNRFHRGVDGPGGAGLGLAIADVVVRATHGRWDIGASTLGGAAMAVSWPRVPPYGREAARPVGGVQPQAP